MQESITRFVVKLNLGGEDIIINPKVKSRTVQIEENRANKRNRYLPDKLKIELFELTENVNLIEQIRKHPGSIIAKVFKKSEKTGSTSENLYFQGTIQTKKTLKIDRDIQVYTLQANDLVSNLGVVNKDPWKIRNQFIGSIVDEVVNHTIGVPTSFPNEMWSKRADFIVTDTESTVLKILNNFLFEYGFVLKAFYSGNTAYVGALSTRDYQTAHSTPITELDIAGNVQHKISEIKNKDMKVFSVNYAITQELKNIVLYADGITEQIWVQAGEYWPENGDSEIQYQEYNLFNKYTLEKSPDSFDPNSKLDWGTIDKDSRIIFAENQRTSYYPVIGSLEDWFFHTEEHFPTHSRVVIGRRATSIYLGNEYRVVGDTTVRKLPPGCSARLTREQFLEENPQYKAPNIPRNWIDDRLEIHNSDLGKWTPTRFFRTSAWYPTRAEALEAAAVEETERRCDGDSRPVQEPVFESRPTRKLNYPGRFADFYIRGDAIVATGIGTAYAGIFNSGDTRTREYEINHITSGDSIDSQTGRPVTIMSYQFIDTPTVTGILDPIQINDTFQNWHMLTENGTLAKITRYIGDTQIQNDRWGHPIIPAGYIPGTVEFQYVDGLLPVRFEERTSTFGGNPARQGGLRPYRYNYPVPIHDKRGTKAVFIPPGDPIIEEIEETSFLYKHQDAADFVQSVSNEASVDDTELHYEGYTDRYVEKIQREGRASHPIAHPRVGEYVTITIPPDRVDTKTPLDQFEGERYVVSKYTIKLEEVNNPKVKIVLKRTSRFIPNKTYPGLKRFFPDIATGEFDPRPVEDRIYAYTQGNGIDPRLVPDPARPFGTPGADGNVSWTTIPDRNRQLLSREIQGRNRNE